MFKTEMDQFRSAVVKLVKCSITEFTDMGNSL